MSALGQKQTHAVRQRMSALSPIATVKADIRKTSCLLYPQKQTCAAHYPMSALGQKRTWPASVDYFVGAGNGGRGNGQAESLGRVEIEHQLKLRRLQDRHFCGV